MYATNASISSNQDGINTTEMLFTYSEEEKQQIQVNKANSNRVFSPKFIPYYPKLAKLGIPDKAIIIYGFIDFYTSSGTGRFYFTNSQISEMLSCSEDSVTKSLKTLEGLGLVKVKRKIRAGGGQIRFIQVNEGKTQKISDSDSENFGVATQKKPRSNNNKIKDIIYNGQNYSRNELLDLLFKEFWALYPKKVAKGTAHKRFLSSFTGEKEVLGLYKKIIQGLQNQIPQMQKQDKKYIPHASTWLNAQRWEDETETEKTYSLPEMK